MRNLFASMAIAGLLLSTGAAAAPASEDTQTYSVAINYADLNLHSAEGLEAFGSRVKSEARRVCGATKVTPLQESLEIRQCRAQLIRSANNRIETAVASRSASGAVQAVR